MDIKRVFSAALALSLTATLAPAALAVEVETEPADLQPLIAPGPQVDMPRVEVPAPGGGYAVSITVNGKPVESFDFDREVPGWGSQKVTWQVKDLSPAPAGYVPIRAVAQADHGSSYWNKEGNESWFNLSGCQITVSFEDLSVMVDDEKLEGVSAVLEDGVTYLPVSVLDGLEGFEVVDNSADGAESYEITTPNGTPMMKLAWQLMETGGIGYGMKTTAEDFETYQKENTGFSADFFTESVLFTPMMTTPDTLVLGKVAEGKLDELKDSMEAYRKIQEGTFSWYLSGNLPKVENAQVAVEGDWFLFIIAENAEAAVEEFHTAVKAMEEA